MVKNKRRSVCCAHSYCTTYTTNPPGFCNGHQDYTMGDILAAAVAPKRLPYSYQAKVRIIRHDASATKEVEWGGVERAADAEEVKELAILHFAAKVLPEFPGYKVGGKFEVFAVVASDGGWSS